MIRTKNVPNVKYFKSNTRHPNSMHLLPTQKKQKDIKRNKLKKMHHRTICD